MNIEEKAEKLVATVAAMDAEGENIDRIKKAYESTADDAEAQALLSELEKADAKLKKLVDEYMAFFA